MHRRTLLVSIVLSIVGWLPVPGSAASPTSAHPAHLDSIAESLGVSTSEVWRRVQRERAVGELSSQAAALWPETFAGLWVDHDDGGRVVAAFTKDAAHRQTDLRRTFRWPGLVRTAPARHSYAALQRLQHVMIVDRELARAGRLTIPGTSGAQYDLDIDVRNNRLVVRVSEVTDEVRAGFRKRYGLAVDIRPGLARPHGSCTTDDCRHTLMAGLATTDCSTGFVTRTNGVLGIFSAAHCTAPPAHSGRTYGTVIAEQQSGRVDAEWHRLTPNTGFDAGPFHYMGDNQWNAGYSWVHSTVTWNGMFIGQINCVLGQFTRSHSCGQVTSKDGAPWWVTGSNRFIVSDVCEGPGDSGAGVYDLGDDAVGLISGGNSQCGLGKVTYISQIEYVQAALGQSVWTGDEDRSAQLQSISTTALSPAVMVKFNVPVLCSPIDQSAFEINVDDNVPRTILAATCTEYTNATMTLTLDKPLLPGSHVTVTALYCRFHALRYSWSCPDPSSQSATVGLLPPL